jgi:hypothetical protein
VKYEEMGKDYTSSSGTLPLIPVEVSQGVVKKEIKATNKPSKLNNFKGKRHTFTEKDARKGGKTMTTYRLKSLKLRKIKYCGSNCPIYPCKYQPLSSEMYGNRCALKNQEPDIRRKYINLLLGGEDDLFTEATNALMTVKGGYKTVMCIEKIHKMRFGAKVKNEVVATTGSFFDELRDKVKNLKEDDKK